MANPIVWMAHPLSAPTPEGIALNLMHAKLWLAWLYRTFPGVDFAAAWIPCCEAMNDADPAERERGLQFDCEMVRRLDGYWMVGGRVSSGMERERAAAMAAGKPVVDLTFLGNVPPGDVLWGTTPHFVRRAITKSLQAAGYLWLAVVRRKRQIHVFESMDALARYSLAGEVDAG
jgi:hypothetical protein